ncbi:hypothetical protein [Phytoactinopolyspora mesophila]|uniref:Uncharacterized protein n=1 Tax=Phytoactinopolyspora mesophila TaxID=2650750 RepID=A0A7K3M3D3_9ACTN|nr:hypothetical protein [Phytoactinopolyspora mesophila]NDL57756.1 hypothetical protein [Phytoactinopolyspora mesophila]
MGLWRRRPDDARSIEHAADVSGPRTHNRSADDARLPPLDLDRGAPGAPGESDQWPGEPPSVRSWRPWAALGLALVVGATAGVVGTNARHDAIQQSRVELVGGTVHIDGTGTANSADTWTAEFSVFNAGQRAVEVMELEIEGWVFVGHGGSRESVVAEPADWTTWTIRISPECDDQPTAGEATGSLTTTALVRSGAQETTTSVEFPQQRIHLRDTWTWACSGGDSGYPFVFVEAADALPRESGDDVLHTEFRLSTEAFSADAADDVDAAVVRLWAHAPGFDVTATNLPVELTTHSTVAVDIQWQLTSCSDADELDFIQLSLHVSADTSGDSARVQQNDVPVPVLMELGRMVGDVCGE